MAIDAESDLYIAVPGKILYLLDVHAGLAKTCDISMAKQVRSHLEVQRLLDLWAALFSLFLSVPAVFLPLASGKIDNITGPSSIRRIFRLPKIGWACFSLEAFVLYIS